MQVFKKLQELTRLWESCRFFMLDHNIVGGFGSCSNVNNILSVVDWVSYVAYGIINSWSEIPTLQGTALCCVDLQFTTGIT